MLGAQPAVVEVGVELLSEAADREYRRDLAIRRHRLGPSARRDPVASQSSTACFTVYMADVYSPSRSSSSATGASPEGNAPQLAPTGVPAKINRVLT